MATLGFVTEPFDAYKEREAEMERYAAESFIGPAIDENVVGYVTIHEPFEVQQTWETACNYTMHEVQPGTYAARMSRDGHFVCIGVDTIVLQNYYVNRVFTASSAHDERPMTPGRYTFQLYDYLVAEQAVVDAPKLIGGDFRLANGWTVVIDHVTLGRLSEKYAPKHHTSRKLKRLV